MCKGAERATPEISIGVIANESKGLDESNRDIKDSSRKAYRPMQQ
jgi:hypothetical protein